MLSVSPKYNPIDSSWLEDESELPTDYDTAISLVNRLLGSAWTTEEARNGRRIPESVVNLVDKVRLARFYSLHGWRVSIRGNFLIFRGRGELS